MRTWQAILLLVALLVVGGLVVVRLQSGEPITFTSGYVTQMDATGALYLSGAVIAIIVSTIGMGVTLALAVKFGSREVAQAQASHPTPARAGRRAEKAAAQPESRLPVQPQTVVKGLAIAANLVALAFIAYLTVNRVINPPKEGGAEAPAGESAAPTVAPAAAAASPAGLQAAFAALPAGDAAKGKAEFAAQPCASCHSLDPDKVIVGPSLAGVATRAASRKPGYSAELYLYESITKPGAYVVQGFNDGVMPANLAQTLTPQQQADLVAFLLTQK